MSEIKTDMKKVARGAARWARRLISRCSSAAHRSSNMPPPP